MRRRMDTRVGFSLCVVWGVISWFTVVPLVDVDVLDERNIQCLHVIGEGFVPSTLTHEHLAIAKYELDLPVGDILAGIGGLSQLHLDWTADGAKYLGDRLVERVVWIFCCVPSTLFPVDQKPWCGQCTVRAVGPVFTSLVRAPRRGSGAPLRVLLQAVP